MSSRTTYIYVGAGWDTKPLTENWTKGITIHCVDGQPHSEFGTEEYYESNGEFFRNMFARPKFAKRVLREYAAVGFTCSQTDRKKITKTGLLNIDTLTGVRTVICFTNTERDTIVWYHFNSGLPTHSDDISKMVGTYDGLICSGHCPHVSIMDSFEIPDHSLIFRGYPNTQYRSECEQSGVVGLDEIKFKCFIFHDLDGREHSFESWTEYLDWIDENSDLAY